MTVQPLRLVEPGPVVGSAIARAELTAVLGTTAHDTVARALTGMAQSTLSLRGGTEETNEVFREVVIALALAEVGEEPVAADYPDTEEGNVDYVEALSRWMDAIDEIADEKTTLVSDVLRAAAGVVTARTQS